uniref:BTB domain-containing protein n=1 Tax=Panagrolaimus sp. ES5 TaxID=591445 RepID=A0AC34FX30_9BILA
MFQSGLKEAKENEVDIKDFSYDVVKKAIKLCYHHSLVTYISLEEKIKLLQFLDKYEIQQLKTSLEAYSVKSVDDSNVCKLINCSLISNALQLQQKCGEFLQTRLQERAPISDLNLLDKDFALNFLQNSFCNVND